MWISFKIKEMKISHDTLEIIIYIFVISNKYTFTSNFRRKRRMKDTKLKIDFFLFCEIEKLNETQKWRRKSGCRMKPCNNAEWCHVDCYFKLHAVVNEKLLPKRVGLNH